MCDEIQIPIKQSKTVNPTTKIVFLGLEIDTIKLEIRLPDEKLAKIRSSIIQALNSKKLTLRQLQSLIGLLNYACTVVSPGRAFLRRVIDLTIGLTKPFYVRRLTQEAKADLHAWSVFLEHFNGKAVLLSDKWESSDSLNLFTDASNLVFGGVFQNKWFYGKWDASWSTVHITIKELFPIVLAIELFANDMANSKVNFYSDNLAVVHIINNQTSKDKLIMRLVRRLVISVLQNNLFFRARHIPGIQNVAADMLSRLQISKFKQLYPHMDQNPTPVQQPLTI
ncbi:hypothetical protein FSP39_013582 [Pinctada imbricata]|uniref:RNase H type-1 domain-containing protein n=1 Tax=Pinctada imbricata TaxID=66713 RepID=A0AA88XMD4_PINIB|nr:hypothetical protein FSP39_013582 [Pinctada imbricata]